MTTGSALTNGESASGSIFIDTSDGDTKVTQQRQPKCMKEEKQVRDPTVAEFWAMSRSAKQICPHTQEPVRHILSVEDARVAETGPDNDYHKRAQPLGGHH